MRPPNLSPMRNVSDAKIQQELQGLYASWSWPLAQGLQEKNKFLQSIQPKAAPQVNTIAPKVEKKSWPKWIKAILTLIPIFIGLYLTYQSYSLKMPITSMP